MFVNNYYKVLAENILGTGQSSDEATNYVNFDGATTAITKATSNLRDNLAFGYSNTALCPYIGRCKQDYASGGGVAFGNGDTPATLDDYKLSGDILSGYSSNCSLQKTYVEGGVSLTAVYTITNNNSKSMEIKEIGLISRAGITALLERTVLDTPITIEPGGVGQVTYTITMNYPTVPEQ